MVSEVFSANKVQIATIAVYVLRGEQFVEVLELACMLYKTSYPPSMEVMEHCSVAHMRFFLMVPSCEPDGTAKHTR